MSKLRDRIDWALSSTARGLHSSAASIEVIRTLVPLDGSPCQMPHPPPPSTSHEEMDRWVSKLADAVQTGVSHQMEHVWRLHGSQIVVFDETLMSELCRSPLPVLNGEFLDRLPFESFMFVYDSESMGRPVVGLVNPARRELAPVPKIPTPIQVSRPCSVADVPDEYAVYLRYQDDDSDGWVSSLLQIPRLENVEINADFDVEYDGCVADEKLERQMPGSMANEIANLLLYLCSEEPDIESRELLNRSKQKRKARRKSRASGQVPETSKVGFRIGAALRAYHARARSETTGGGGTVAPHIRRAHWHLYRHGPERSLVKLRWLPPIPVKLDTTIESLSPTARPVR